MGRRYIKMAKIIQFCMDEKLYGECPFCGCDSFHLIMDIDERIMGSECYGCREEFIYEESVITFELDDNGEN